MNRKSIVSSGAVLVMGLLTATLHAAPQPSMSIVISTINASASVQGVSGLTTDTRMISTDVSTPTAITFGSIGAGATPWAGVPSQYVRVIVDDNALAWRVRAYTDNFSGVHPGTATWGFAFGGLIGPTIPPPGSGAKAPMGWKCSTNTTAGFTPATGNPALIQGQSGYNAWTFLKDSAETIDDDTQPGDQTFATADAAGFPNIAFGNAGSTNVILPELDNPATPGFEGAYALPTRTTPFKFFVEADFSVAAATSYTGVLKLELLNQ